MKRILILLVSVAYVVISMAQVAPGRYWVEFTDKDNTPYSVNNPEEFLSQRAIDRRTDQDIAIIENDLPVNPEYVELVAGTGAIVLNVSKWFNSVTVVANSQDIIDAINDLPFVLSLSKSSANDKNKNLDSEKPFFANESIATVPEEAILKASDATNEYDYGAAYNQIEMLNGIELHNLGYSGEGMIIAILDAGFLNADDISAFDYLWDNNRILGTRDFVNPLDPDIFDSHFHGTNVLSTMGANLPGEYVGTAPEASYYLLRSEDGATEYLIEELNWVSAAEYADSVGADVINSSLGYTTFDDVSQNHSYEDMDGNTTPITRGADLASSKGILVVNSAGNSGGDSWQYIGAPADGDSVFTIGAVNSSGDYAGFSSTGPSYDGRVKPNVVAQGQGAAVINAYSGDVTFGNGTSYSSPITAGMVTCLWQANPGKKNTEIMLAIEQSGTLATNPNDELGYGIPDYMLANDLVTDTGFEYTADNNINVFPNPFNDRLTIKLYDGATEKPRAMLVDVTGKIMFEASFAVASNQYQITGLDELPSGVYFVKVFVNNNTYVQKVIK